MTPSSGQENDPARPRQKPRRRWFQFGLSTLLVVTALAAGGAMAFRVYVEPYRRQRETMALIEKLHGSYKTTAADPWLRWLYGDNFQNITVVDVADCDEPAAYLDQVASLPALHTLMVGGLEFTDAHLRRLQQIPTLQNLVIDSTSVGDEALAALEESLPGLQVFRSERRAIEALGKLPDMYVDTNRDESPSPFRQLLGDKHFERAIEVRTFGPNSIYVGDEDVTYLRSLRHLERLDLSVTRATDESLAYLAGLHHLQEIDLHDTLVTGEGLTHLRGLRQLARLSLRKTQVTDAGLSPLYGLTRLKHLRLEGSKTTRAGIASLQRALPGCRIDGPGE